MLRSLSAHELSLPGNLSLDTGERRGMERYTITATSSNGSLSTPYATFASKPNLRDASFSSYLRPDHSSLAVEPPKRSNASTTDAEISIFDAERYFNENSDQKPIKTSQPLHRIAERCDLSTIRRHSSASSADGYVRSYRTGSFHATPTASSEASWNSQSGLLSNPPGSIAVSIKNLPLNGQQRRVSSSSSSSSTSSYFSSGKWLFGRKCPCSGKKSVDVEEKLPEPKHPIHSNSNPYGSLTLKKQSFKAVEAVSTERAVKESETGIGIEGMAKLKLASGNWATDRDGNRDSNGFLPENGNPEEIGRRTLPSGRPFMDMGSFSFPILNPPPAAGKIVEEDLFSPPEEPPRQSLEVFRRADDACARKSSEFQWRTTATMPFPGENGRRSFTFPASPKGRFGVAMTDDDVTSDSSSDLFEIESFSTSQATSYTMYRCRDSLDDVSNFEGRRFPSAAGMLHFRRSLDESTASAAPTECYEPSEASVEWSVTTADGFDRPSMANFSTAASEYEEVRFIQPDSGRMAAVVAGGGRRKGNGLLSCRCEKAVNVGPNPVKCGPEPHRMAPPGYAIESNRMMSTLSRVAPRVAVSDMPPLARSHSARIAHPLASR